MQQRHDMSRYHGSALHATSLLRGLSVCHCVCLCVCLFLLIGCGSRNSAGNTPESPTKQEAAVVQTAMAAVGTEYQWGGCNPAEGFDCSGLVWWAYHANGYEIPRTTAAQASAGRTVDCTQTRLGDVLVFRLPSKGLHSGIYSGHGHFVHSPKSGHTVREETLQPYWQSKLLTCRRVLH